MMRNSGAFARLLIVAAVALAIPILITSLPASSESVRSLKANDEEVRRTMVQISRQLGVECTTCHNTKNFADSGKATFKVAKDHLRLTQLLIDHGMDGKEKRPKADCFMCHRGQLNPKPEKFDPMTMKKEKAVIPQSDDSGDE